MRIDAHQHYWKIERGDYSWITPDLPILYRDYLPKDLEPMLNRHHIDGSIVVQAAPAIEETNFILSLADQTPSILGVVGWLDLLQKEHRQHFEKFRLHPKFKGFRVMIQDMPDPTLILSEKFVDALRSYADEGVPVDLLLRHEQMDLVLKLIQQMPELRGVIDHISKPPILSREMEPWSLYLAEISTYPNIYCKLSGMVTENGREGWSLEDFVPYIRKTLELFGPNRVLFGSDWPVCLLAAEYDQVMEILLHAIPENWGEQEHSRLFGLNAREFYKL
ncbi:amidohydrolase family protein [Paenibacillus xylanilyticus]|uniref:Amidohydrolase family protein n=1 Tax=Paenibacillus xylanilyticus TaxID=248903 RepID=A0A7Y6C253_9BACL|nr:amidohydrolase family protein [Paenibacillus xylanilyticus]NUU79170.1 amidohydrolase family protein [Paenibacillus xylanilyticus]